MIRWVICLALVVGGVVGATAQVAVAGCGVAANLNEVSEECVNPEVNGVVASGGGDGPVIFLAPLCAFRVNGACAGSLPCVTDNGLPGIFREVFVDGEPAGRWCVAEEEAVRAGVVTPGGVLRAMRRLEWPASELVVQPPDGVTLVNFDTNFFTPDAGPVTRRVRLLGQVVRIEARPSEFVWSFGDGEVVRTSDPGAAYPDLRVTHAYRRTGVVEVGLATIYRGRFRVGGGAWQDVVGSVTVASASESLRVIEATPRLVGY